MQHLVISCHTMDRYTGRTNIYIKIRKQKFNVPAQFDLNLIRVLILPTILYINFNDLHLIYYLLYEEMQLNFTILMTQIIQARKHLRFKKVKLHK